MDYLVALAVLALALLVLAYPLYRGQPQPLTVNTSTLDNLLTRRDGVYAILRDLELDRQLGKLDDADYTALREKYMAQATDMLQELDALRGQGRATEANAEVEQEIAALRRTQKNRTETSDHRVQTAPGENESELHCKNCGRAYHAGDQFCARCGHALN